MEKTQIKIEEAIALVKLTQDLNPDFVYAFAFSADIYWTGGKLELARAGYQKALEIYPCYNIVERWMKELDEEASLSFGSNKYRSRELGILAASLPHLHEHH
jgi:tetratricopeptide (TPR) repeat protein